MQPEGVPADASCLIYIAKVDAFVAASRCVSKLVIPPGVWREAVDDGERFGYADAERIRAAESEHLVERIELDSATQDGAERIVGAWRLGQGESEALALGSQVGRVLVDDGRAARVAEAIGVVPISTLFLPVLGVAQGLSRSDATRLLHDLAIVMSARAETVFEIERYLRGRP